MFKLTNKTAVITGGGSGIGRAMAILFAQQGAKVHIIELNADASAATVNEITAAGGSQAFAHMHATSATSNRLLKRSTRSAKSILINNAGIAHIGKADTTSEADFDRIYSVNIKGAYNCLFAAIPLMKANKRRCDFEHSIYRGKRVGLLTALLTPPVRVLYTR